jgi:glycosyltransferase involved in cell wall biosynthesis
MADLSILMPAYNERPTIERAIERVLATDLPVSDFELIVVDDGSTDGTRELLTGRDWPSPLKLVLHDRNMGKGAAVRTALAQAQGTYSVILDADLEYDPADLQRLLPPLRNGQAEVVFGTRAFAAHSSYGFWYVVGNKAVTMAANILYDCWLTDIMSCWKLMPTSLFRSLDLREPGFGIEPEIAARLLRAGTRIYEVPIDYMARSREEGKKLTTGDGFRVLRTLLRCRFG